jgi:carnitine-CoA ligase
MSVPEQESSMPPQLVPRPPGQKLSAEDDDAISIALDPEWVLPRRIAWWAERDPERPFLQEVTGRSVSYAEVVDGIRRWASVLRKHGIVPGDRVLSMMPPSIDGYLLWMAASCIGACEVPINPDLRGPFLEHALTDARARICFGRPEFVSVAESAGIEGLDVVAVERDHPPTIDAVPGDIEWPAPEAASCVIYTSGTTGPAKGVIVSWAQMTATIGRLPRTWFSSSDAVYCAHAMFHVTGRSPLPSMADVGGRVVMREKFSVTHFWDDIRRFGCTSTTAFAPMLLALPEAEDDQDNPLRVCFGGHDGRQRRRFSERFDVHLVEFYGSTEAGFPIGLRWHRDEADQRKDIGWLRRGYEARVVDEKGADLAAGLAGELWIKPPARNLMMLGYLGRPEQTEKALGDGWYRTGDAVIRHEDESFEFVDRIKDTIRRKGENISSSALEAAVITDSEVQDCAAIGIRDKASGQEVLLAIVAVDGSEIDLPALYDRLTELLPRYMHPAYLIAIDDADVPRTPTNKIQKNRLLEKLDLDQAFQPRRTRRARDSSA